MAYQSETPKQRFVKDKARTEAHRFIVSHAQFQDSIDQAMLEYQNQLLRSQPDNVLAAGKAFALAGAQEFVAILKNLSEIPTAPKTAPTGMLDHKA